MRPLLILFIASLLTISFFAGCQKITPDTSITVKAGISSIYVQLPLAADTLTGTVKTAQNTKLKTL